MSAQIVVHRAPPPHQFQRIVVPDEDSWREFDEGRLVGHRVGTDPVEDDPVTFRQLRRVSQDCQAIVLHTGEAADHLFGNRFLRSGIDSHIELPLSPKEGIDIGATGISDHVPVISDEFDVDYL